MYLQTDPRWKNQRLGTVNGSTLGAYGCFVSSQAMIATHYRHPINPAELDDLFTNRKLYANGNMLSGPEVCRVYPDIEYLGWEDFANRPMNMDRLYMNDQEEIIIKLDYDHKIANGIQTHFVRVFNWDGSKLLLDDPIWGRCLFTDHYGSNPKETICGLARYIKRDFKTDKQLAEEKRATEEAQKQAKEALKRQQEEAKIAEEARKAEEMKQLEIQRLKAEEMKKTVDATKDSVDLIKDRLENVEIQVETVEVKHDDLEKAVEDIIVNNEIPSSDATTSDLKPKDVITTNNKESEAPMSERFMLNLRDFIKSARDAFMVAAGTVILQFLDVLKTQDYGNYTALIIAGIVYVATLVRRFFRQP